MNPRQVEFNLQTNQEIIRSLARERITAINEVVNDDSLPPIFYDEPIRDEGERSVTEEAFSKRVSSNHKIDEKVDAADNAQGFGARMSTIRKIKSDAAKYLLRAENESKKIEKLLSNLNDRGETYNPNLISPSMLSDSDEGYMNTYAILLRSAHSFDERYVKTNPGAMGNQGVEDYLRSLGGESGVEISGDDKDTLTLLAIITANNLKKRMGFWSERYDVLHTMELQHLGKTAMGARIAAVEASMSDEIKDRRYIVDDVLRH